MLTGEMDGTKLLQRGSWTPSTSTRHQDHCPAVSKLHYGLRDARLLLSWLFVSQKHCWKFLLNYKFKYCLISSVHQVTQCSLKYGFGGFVESFLSKHLINKNKNGYLKSEIKYQWYSLTLRKVLLATGITPLTWLCPGWGALACSWDISTANTLPSWG